MVNSNFQQAREGVLDLLGEFTEGWTAAEKKEARNTVNAIFFSGQIKPHPLTSARLKAQAEGEV
ncbi:hypothetical protein [Microbacterium sp. KR10-403]|uniref:hypothetical protein n=1 Tax=Microbacterium sp. KR10-403 TaxID=3158581 RepID=UPI0032E3BFC1